MREEAVARLKEKLEKEEAKQLIVNSTYWHYLKLTREKVSLDEETRYDGRYLLRTNNTSMKLKEVPMPTKASGRWSRPSKS